MTFLGWSKKGETMLINIKMIGGAKSKKVDYCSYIPSFSLDLVLTVNEPEVIYKQHLITILRKQPTVMSSNCLIFFFLSEMCLSAY